MAQSLNAAQEANRRRYEELRALGQGATLADLPPITARSAVSIAPASLLEQEAVPAGWYTTMRLRRAEVLRVVDVSGSATPALIAWRAGDASERMNLADSVKVQWTSRLQRGRIVLSDMGRVLFSIIEDTCGAHDALVGGSGCGCSSNASWPRNTRANFVAAVGKLGLDRRDIPAALSLFCPIAIDRNGCFEWQAERKAKGDFVDLRAEMDVLLAISNCRHPLQSAAPDEPYPIRLIRHLGRDYGLEDPCRNGGPEVARAFDFTERLFR
jgi:urea carboxylase-associated protein 2